MMKGQVKAVQFVFSKPYLEVAPLNYGMLEKEVISVLGKPDKILTTRKGETDYRFASCSLRFGKQSGRLVEIGFFPGSDIVILGRNPFLEPFAFKDLIKRDGATLEFAGVLFMPVLGITLTGFIDSNPSEQSVTGFERGRLDHLLQHFVPYRS